MPSTLSRNRSWVICFFICSLFLLMIYQLIQLTIIRRPALLQLAEKQHRLSIDIPPFRGAIYDRQGKELATNLKSPSVYAVPRMLAVSDRDALSAKVSKMLGLDIKFVKDRLSRDKSFVWLKRNTSYEDAEAIQALQSPALGVVKEYRRFYPQGDLLSHVMGFTNIDNEGMEGIELSLNRELQGRRGKRYTKRDALGREIRAFEIKQIPSVDGHKVTLTIDQYMQYLTERALDKAFTTWKAKGAVAVVLEAKTGRILALANRPTFNPNFPGRANADTRRDRVVTDMYEPGSVFKIVAVSAALNEGKVTPEQTFFCENGAYRYSGSRVLHDVHPYGKLTVEEVVIKSSNIGTVKIASKLSPSVLQSYIDAYGFGKRTQVDLPGEAPGFTRPPSQWSNTSPYNVPIGHEVMVTALQMASAFAVIANGGDLMQPYILEKVQDQAGVVLKEKKPTVRRNVIRPEVAATMRRILTRVVDEGTGKTAQIPGIPVAGKTGTAQKVLPGGRGYSHNSFMSSFIGFAPADDPQFVMAVVLDDPKPLYYGGTVAAPVFKEVMENALYSMGYVPATAQKLEPSTSRTEVKEITQTQPIARPNPGAGTRL